MTPDLGGLAVGVFSVLALIALYCNVDAFSDGNVGAAKSTPETTHEN